MAVVLDLFSRKVIRWAARQTIHRELVLDALLMAVQQRRPEITTVYSEQGSQYSSDDWRRFFRTNKREPDLSRRGNCWDNAVAESFISRLTKERIKNRIYKKREITTADVSAYINSFYDPTRRHQHLSCVSPDEFEAAAKRPKAGVY